MSYIKYNWKIFKEVKLTELTQQELIDIINNTKEIWKNDDGIFKQIPYNDPTPTPYNPFKWTYEPDTWITC